MGRNYLIDVLKSFGAVAVVLIHVTAIINNRNLDTFWNYHWYRPLFNFAVPFFFATSGYFLFHKIKERSDGLNYLWNYAMKILKYYIVFSLFYIAFSFSVQLFDYLFLKESLRTSIAQIIGGWSYVKILNGTIGQYHLWFLSSLFIAVLVLMLLFKFKINAKTILLLSIIVYSLSLVGFITIDDLYIYGGLTKGFFYLSIGYFVASIGPKKVVRPIAGFLVSFLIYYACILKNLPISELPLALMAFYLVAICTEYPHVGKGSILAKIGAESLGIYILHLFARDIVMKIYIYSGVINYYDFISYYVVATLISIVLPLLIFKFMSPYLDKFKLIVTR